jgi:excisionase family DNA binding protein
LKSRRVIRAGGARGALKDGSRVKVEAAAGGSVQGERLLKAGAVADLLGLGRTKVYDMIARGELPVVRIGTAVRVPQSKLMQFIESKTVMPTVQ